MTGNLKRVCPVCKDPNYSIFMKENAYNNRDHIQLLKCTGCGFVYSKSISIEYSSFGKSASKKSIEELNKASDLQRIPELVAEILSKTSIKQGGILDFGCGVGLMLRGFKKNNFDLLGVEDSDAFRNMLTQAGISTVASLSEINESRGSFDIVIVKDVLEHLEEPVEMLDEIISFIKPGGFLYLRVPNRNAYPFHWAVDTKGHVNHFTPASLKKVMLHTGLEFYDYVNVYDTSSRIGKLYNFIFWKLRHLLPMTHQVSLLYKNIV